MTTPNPLSQESLPDSASSRTLIEQLQESMSWKHKSLWPAYIFSVFYGVISALQGSSFLMVYCGALVVVFTIHGVIEERNRKQMNLLLQLVQELERKKSSNGSV